MPVNTRVETNKGINQVKSLTYHFLLTTPSMIDYLFTWPFCPGPWKTLGSDPSR